MTILIRPFLFAKALYLDRKQRKRIEQLEEETLEKVREILDSNQTINLELGHSHIGANDWLTLDLNLGCDLFWDYRNGIPFPSSAVDVLYSHNSLQRLNSQQLDFLLRECYRILKPGGAFFFTVPDAEPILKAYAERRAYYNSNHQIIWKPGWHESGSCMDQVTYTAYCNGHVQSMFDRENVVHFCEKAGFLPTELRTPDTSIDGHQLPPDTLYVLARKPA